MKTTKYKLILFLILTLPILFLSACLELSDADWELVEIAFENWAEENGLLENDEWQPDGVVIKAVENTIGDFNNQKEFVELDGLDVIRDIEKADQLAAEAREEYDQEKMQSAVELRPNDWRLQEQNAILFSLNGYSYESSGAFSESDRTANGQAPRGKECLALRKQQLEYREILISDNLDTCYQIADCDVSVLTSQLQHVNDELNLIDGIGSIDGSGSSPNCDDSPLYDGN